MADRLEVSKINEFVVLGPPADSLVVSKITMFVLLMPGTEGPAEPHGRQGHFYVQRVRRAGSAVSDDDAVLGSSSDDSLIWTG